MAWTSSDAESGSNYRRRSTPQKLGFGAKLATTGVQTQATVLMDQDQALTALHAGELVEAIAKPSADANGWLLVFVTRRGEQLPYSGHTGTEKVYHTLDHATEAARDIGFDTIRVEESF